MLTQFVLQIAAYDTFVKKKNGHLSHSGDERCHALSEQPVHGSDAITNRGNPICLFCRHILKDSPWQSSKRWLLVAGSSPLILPESVNWFMIWVKNGANRWNCPCLKHLTNRLTPIYRKSMNGLHVPSIVRSTVIRRINPFHPVS